MARRIGRGYSRPAGVVGGGPRRPARRASSRGFVGGIGGPSHFGRGGTTGQELEGRFEKSSDFVTGDFLGKAKVGDLGVQTTTGTYWSCTNAATAAWQKIGLQT
jgi:hypothetical protein